METAKFTAEKCASYTANTISVSPKKLGSGTCLRRASTHVPCSSKYVANKINKTREYQNAVVNTQLSHTAFNLPIIKIKIGSLELFALIDTGASISIIETSTFKRISQQFVKKQQDPSINILSLSGQEIKTAGFYELNLQIGHENVKHSFFLSTQNFNAPYQVIIGFDFLKKFKCLINAKNNTFNIGNTSITFCTRASNSISTLIHSNFARLKNSLKLPPRAQKIVELKVDSTIPQNSMVLIEPVIRNSDLEIHASVNNIQPNNSISVWINNLSDKPVHVNKNSKIALIQNDVQVVQEKSQGKYRRHFDKITEDDFNLDNVPPQHKQKLVNLLLEYSDIFSKSLRTIGRTDLIHPRIKLINNFPVCCKPFKIPHALKEIAFQQIQELLQANIIEKSNSSYAFPLILVKKKNNDYRLVVDYRKLNELIAPEPYRLPLMQDILDSLRGNKYFSTLDLNSSFHQIELDPRDRHLTTFTCDFGTYNYKCLPFGLKISPPIFQKLADTLLHDLQQFSVKTYIDDIIIPSETIDDSLNKLRLVFDRLRAANLTISPKKCKFLQTSITYLGHTISESGMTPAKENLHNIQDFPRPTTARKVKRFIGVCNYFRKYIPRFSELIKPLTDLTRSNIKFKWSPEAENAFINLKQKLLSQPILRHPDFNKEFFLVTDASTCSLSAILCQKYFDILHPIAYFSKKLKNNEARWATLDLELYAIVSGVQYFKQYLYGRKFTILSDHKSLSYFLKLDSPAGRVSRWLLKLSEYTFDFQHIPGKNNILADYFSRENFETVNTINVDIPDITHVKQEQRKDNTLIKIIDSLEGRNINCTKGYDMYYLENDILMHLAKPDEASPQQTFIQQLVIPESLKAQILFAFHTPHYAFQKQYKNMRQKYFWPNMYSDVKNYTGSCTDCLERKGFLQTHAPLQRVPIPHRPMERLSLDIIGPLPPSQLNHRFILCIIDNFTRYAQFYPIREQTADSIAEKLLDFIAVHGVPKSILTDQGTNFMSNVMKKLAEKFNIKQLRTTPYRPSTNSINERTHKSLIDCLACVARNNRKWDKVLKLYALFYNTAFHESLGTNPAYLMFGRNLDLPYDILHTEYHTSNKNDYVDRLIPELKQAYEKVRQNLKVAAEKQEMYKNKDAKLRTFTPGQLVYLFTPRLEAGKAFSRRFSGPWEVIHKHTDVNYTIKSLNSENPRSQRVHVDRIFPFTPRHDNLKLPTQPDNTIPKSVALPTFQEFEEEYSAIFGNDTSIRQENDSETQSANQEQATQILPPADSINTQSKDTVGEKVTPTHSYNLRSRSVPDSSHITNVDVNQNTNEITSGNQNNLVNSLWDNVMQWALNEESSSNTDSIFNRLSQSLRQNEAQNIDHVNSVKVYDNKWSPSLLLILKK